MNNVWILLKVQLLGALGLNKALHTKDSRERRSKLAMFCVMCTVYLMIGGCSFIYIQAFAQGASSLGALDVLPAMIFACSSFVTILYTVNAADGTIYRFKDYDTMMSLPVKTSHIVASRVLMLYFINLFFTLLIMLPGGMAYALAANPEGGFYPIYLLCTLAVPLVPILIAITLGTLVSLLASRFRHSNVITILLLLVLVAGLMAWAWNSQKVTLQQGVSASEVIMATVTVMMTTLYPPTQLFTQAVCGGSIPSFAAFLLGSILLFVLACVLLAFLFKPLNSRLSVGQTHKKFHFSSMKASSPFHALFQKEWKRYWRVPIYVMNTGMGSILLVLLSAALLIFRPEQLEAALGLPGFSEVIGRVLPLGVSLLMVMDCTTACSISLEGKNLWLLRSAPVETKTVFHSKLAVNLLVSLPAIAVGGALLCVALRPAPLEAVFLFLTPAVYALFISLFGLLANLKIPNFEWTTEMTVVKQSMPVMISLLAGFVAVGVPLGISFAFPQLSAAALNGAATAVIALICALMYYGVNTKGAKWFAKL